MTGTGYRILVHAAEAFDGMYCMQFLINTFFKPRDPCIRKEFFINADLVVKTSTEWENVVCGNMILLQALSLLNVSIDGGNLSMSECHSHNTCG